MKLFLIAIRLRWSQGFSVAMVISCFALGSACSKYEISRPFFSKDAPQAADGEGDGNGKGKDNTDTEIKDPVVPLPPPTGLPDPKTLSFQLIPDATHDAVDFTFGVASVELKNVEAEGKLSINRFVLNPSAKVLTDSENEALLRLCRDIGLSSEAANYRELSQWNKGEPIFVIWRSYYAGATKSALTDILMKSGRSKGAVCLLSIELGDDKTQELNIIFDPSATAPAPVAVSLSVSAAATHGGTSRLDEAFKLGLMLPQLAASVKPTNSESLIPVLAAPEILLKVPPLLLDKIKLQAEPVAQSASSVSSTLGCTLSASGGKTHVANPYLKNPYLYSIVSDQEMELVGATVKPVGGRMLKECQSIKMDTQAKDKKLNFVVTCGEYQAIKDQGLEAGCGWDIAIVNPKDKENSVLLPMTMAKIAYSTVDSSRTAEAIRLMPRSDFNPFRNGDTQLQGFSKAQGLALEDAIDLWIAVDEEGYRRDYMKKVKTISFSTIEACTTGAGAYAPYGGDAIFWCLAGDMTEGSVAQRFTNPTSLVYRSILAYHETRHTRNWTHDSETQSYAPCEGTAQAGIVAYMLATKCDYDYCKVMLDAAILDFKNEINYDYNGDTSGRKAAGKCKTWSSEMNITGGGF